MPHPKAWPRLQASLISVRTAAAPSTISLSAVGSRPLRGGVTVDIRHVGTLRPV